MAAASHMVQDWSSAEISLGCRLAMRCMEDTPAVEIRGRYMTSISQILIRNVVREASSMIIRIFMYITKH